MDYKKKHTELKDYSELGAHVPDSGLFATFSILKFKCKSPFVFGKYCLL